MRLGVSVELLCDGLPWFSKLQTGGFQTTTAEAFITPATRRSARVRYEYVKHEAYIAVDPICFVSDALAPTRALPRSLR